MARRRAQSPGYQEHPEPEGTSVQGFGASRAYQLSRLVSGWYKVLGFRAFVLGFRASGCWGLGLALQGLVGLVLWWVHWGFGRT